MNKIELSKQRKKLDSLIDRQDSLYLLIMDGKYWSQIKDGILPFAVKNSGYTLADKDSIRAVYTERLKDFLTLPESTLQKVVEYIDSFKKVNKKVHSHRYTVVAMKEIKSIISKFLNGKIDANLNFVK